MKRVRTVTSIADALTANRFAVRSTRHLSTASLSLNRHTGPSKVIASRRPLVASIYLQKPSITVRHESTTVESKENIEDNGLDITPLYEMHELEGAKFVPFGGYEMPVSYEGQSITDSHKFTRSHCSIFDVSHMVQHKFSGPGVTAFLQTITPASLTTLAPHHSTLSAFLWPITGGIVDDTIITRLGPEDFYIVTNAGCREKDLKYLEDQLAQFLQNGGEAVNWEVMEDWGLIAVQGPLSEEILQSVLEDPDKTNLKELYFGQSKFLEIKTDIGPKLCLVSRGGYTGEDGFEISIDPDDTVAVTVSILEAGDPHYPAEETDEIDGLEDTSAAKNSNTGSAFDSKIEPAKAGESEEAAAGSAIDRFLEEGKASEKEEGADDRVKLAGLAARDSLRLEAGMCLYGHDLDDTTTPVEASLSWIIGKDRRAEGGFHGAEVILKQLIPKSKGGLGVERRRVGFIVQGAPAREGAEIVDDKGEKIGNITSGCPSPSLGKFIAMGYIKDGLHKSGTEVTVMIRGKPRKATVTKMPFVPSKYWKPSN
ncbi:hypothetical protein BP6252_01043 [Coleophoma cylindrospora]|uniref:aminomethyltransferase n=1 Tax=Coleophoma cylindrospora TaxID=1849047 RepID=A0A3D8SS57_9HELO|nr:hypothetical protein BP6252_01043 [Coleophoma cylindrospora]